MVTTARTEGLHGEVEPGFEPIADRLGEFVAADPTFAGTLSVSHHGRPVIDLWWGPGAQPDELLPVFSSSKGATGIVVACLVRDGLVDLDAPVASLWPEFAAGGKEAVTVRQLLSHQAGLLGVDGGYDYAALYGHAPLAARLAAQRPHWAPGSAHAYHALTIGVLADEIVLRVTGQRLGAYLRTHVTEPRGLDVYLGTPASEDGRVVAVELPTAQELAASGDVVAAAPKGSIGWLALPDDQPNMLVECNAERFRRAGTPAGGGLANGRGLAGLYASIHHDVGGVRRLLDEETVALVSQQQVWGPELTSPFPSAFAVVFQKPDRPPTLRELPRLRPRRRGRVAGLLRSPLRRLVRVHGASDPVAGWRGRAGAPAQPRRPALLCGRRRGDTTRGVVTDLTGLQSAANASPIFAAGSPRQRRPARLPGPEQVRDPRGGRPPSSRSHRDSPRGWRDRSWSTRHVS